MRMRCHWGSLLINWSRRRRMAWNRSPVGFCPPIWLKAEFLRQVSPQDTLHGDPGNAGAARSEGTGNPAIHRLAHERNALLFAQGMAVAEVETHTPKAEGRDFQLTFSKFAFLHFVSFRERISRPE
jgi:hypothetical protein